MALPILRNIRASVTMSAANTYTESEVNLALSLESRFLYFVTAVQSCLRNPAAAMDGDTDYSWHIARASQVAVLPISNSSVLWGNGLARVQTTTGGSVFETGSTQHMSPAYAVANPSLFFGLNSTSAGLAIIVDWNIWYYPMKVTQNQFWEASQTR